MNVFRFKIQLQGITPPIWRIIDVPKDYTFWALHVAIQDAMGWLDSHLHHFEVKNPGTGNIDSIGLVHHDFDLEYTEGMISDRDVFIRDYFSLSNRHARYLYDYGDGWIHNIELLEILPAKKGLQYPRCVAGERACPPEDCGGVWGYLRICEIIKDPSHPEYENTLQWLGGEYDPDYFDPDEVVFKDPEARWDDIF